MRVLDHTSTDTVQAHTEQALQRLRAGPSGERLARDILLILACRYAACVGDSGLWNVLVNTRTDQAWMVDIEERRHSLPPLGRPDLRDLMESRRTVRRDVALYIGNVLGTKHRGFSKQLLPIFADVLCAPGFMDAWRTCAARLQQQPHIEIAQERLTHITHLFVLAEQAGAIVRQDVATESASAAAGAAAAAKKKLTQKKKKKKTPTKKRESSKSSKSKQSQKSGEEEPRKQQQQQVEMKKKKKKVIVIDDGDDDTDMTAAD